MIGLVKFQHLAENLPPIFFCDVNPSVDNAKFKPLKKDGDFRRDKMNCKSVKRSTSRGRKKKVT